MSLEDRCTYTDQKEIIVKQGPVLKPEGFQFRWVNLATPAGKEPPLSKGKWNEPVPAVPKPFPKNSVLEIVDGEETFIFVPSGLKCAVRYKTSEKKDMCELSFPEGNNGIDLSRLQLIDPSGIRYFLGSGSITKGMSWYLPDSADVSAKAGGWQLVADRYGAEAVTFDSH